MLDKHAGEKQNSKAYWHRTLAKHTQAEHTGKAHWPKANRALARALASKACCQRILKEQSILVERTINSKAHY